MCSWRESLMTVYRWALKLLSGFQIWERPCVWSARASSRSPGDATTAVPAERFEIRKLCFFLLNEQIGLTDICLLWQQVVCQACSSNKYYLEYLKNQLARVCDHCYIKLQHKGTRFLLSTNLLVSSFMFSSFNFSTSSVVYLTCLFLAVFAHTWP